MYKGMRVGVVVPAYNEEKLIGKTLSTMPELVDRIFVIDDCSTDATSEAAAAVHDPRVEIIRQPKNTGVGGAIITGHRRVLDEGLDVSVVMAGDAQMDPDYLPALLDPIADDDVRFTKANRFYTRTSTAGMPAYRQFGNVVLSVMTKFSSGYYHLFDPQNGYTALHRDALSRLDLDEIAANYSFENSLLIHLNVLRVRARDVPIPAIYGDEVSTMRMRKVIPALLRTLIGGFWMRIWRKYVFPSFAPFALLFFSGLALTTLGVGAAVVITVLALNDVTASPATVMISIAPLLAGIQLLISALSMDISESPD
ncbi:glycosyltransferase family 2 protein [Pimelobacter simplex]|uniref:Glycosyltransferase family 2 protein n=2 Tax=Nocardioides simplex TaxID=2045 RepID=A0A7J5DSR8_NOCSI|nr:glycosyltransferase family 2 protein [Pimelobacter simplex]